MAQPMIGEVRMFCGNFEPRDWAFCNGQLLPITGNEALFSILGTIYGGDGRTTFALPDLRGRVAMHPGTGPGLSERRLGQKGGSENLNPTLVRVAGSANDGTLPVLTAVFEGGATDLNIQPFQCVNYIIALRGIFPSRS